MKLNTIRNMYAKGINMLYIAKIKKTIDSDCLKILTFKNDNVKKTKLPILIARIRVGNVFCSVCPSVDRWSPCPPRHNGIGQWPSSTQLGPRYHGIALLPPSPIASLDTGPAGGGIQLKEFFIK